MDLSWAKPSDATKAPTRFSALRIIAGARAQQLRARKPRKGAPLGEAVQAVLAGQHALEQRGGG